MGLCRAEYIPKFLFWENPELQIKTDFAGEFQGRFLLYEIHSGIETETPWSFNCTGPQVGLGKERCLSVYKKIKRFLLKISF